MSNDNKKKNNFIHSPLLIAVVASSLLVTAYSACQKDGLYSYYNYDYKMPFMTLALRGLADGATPFYVTEDFVEMAQSQDPDYYIDMARTTPEATGGEDNGSAYNGNDNGSNTAAGTDSSQSLDNNVGSGSDAGSGSSGIDNAGNSGSAGNGNSGGSGSAGNGNSGTSGSAGTEGSGSAGTDSSAGSESSGDAGAGGSSDSQEAASVEPEVEEFPYMTTTGEVDADYFADALFIGDSRTVGLSEYCAELDEQATFYGKVSLSIYEANNKSFVKTSGGKVTLEKALEGKDFKKVYIMVGINEIGYGSTDGWISSYTEVITKIQAACPDAIIYLQAIMHVTREYDNTKAPDASINGVINTRSEALKGLADNRRIFYLNINEVFDDDYGDLQADISFDGVHLKASAYTTWYEYLRTHAAEVPKE